MCEMSTSFLPVLETRVAPVTGRFGELVAVHIGVTERALRNRVVLKFGSRGMTTKTGLLRVTCLEGKACRRMVKVSLRPPDG